MNMCTVCMYLYTYILCVCICIYILICVCVRDYMYNAFKYVLYIYIHIYTYVPCFLQHKNQYVCFFTNASILIWSVSCLKINNGEHVCDIDFYRGYV